MFVCQPIFQIPYRYILAQLLLLRTKSLGRVLSTTRCHQPRACPAWMQAQVTGCSVLQTLNKQGRTIMDINGTALLQQKAPQHSTLTFGGKVVLVHLGRLNHFPALEKKITPSNVLTQSAISILRTSDILYTFMHVIFITGKLPFYKSHYWNRSPCI